MCVCVCEIFLLLRSIEEKKLYIKKNIYYYYYISIFSMLILNRKMLNLKIRADTKKINGIYEHRFFLKC